MSEETRHIRSGHLEELVGAGKLQEAADLLAAVHASDAADALQDLDSDDAAEVLLLMPREQAADILEDLPDDLAAAAISEMQPKEAAEIVSELESDEEADILQEVADPQVEAIIGHLDIEQAERAREMLAYDEDTAGGLMQKEFIAVSADKVASDVVKHLRSLAEEGEFYPFSYIYAVDDEGRFKGVLSLRALLFTGANTAISALVTDDALTVPPEMPAEELVKVFRRSHLLSVPVVDPAGKMLGIVTQEDAMQFSKEESEEEFLRFSGIAGGEEVRDMPLHRRASKRLIWLVIKMFLNIVPASVVAHYTREPAFALLAPILPIISDMAGSGGSQAIAVSIRELSLGRIKTGDMGWVLAKEIGVGMLNGVILGLLLGLGALLLTGNGLLATVVGASMLASTIVAVTVGGLMPLALRTIKVDPAVASSPVLTMVTDTCGFYFVLALAVALY
jgi:magnesium transporter